MITVGIASIPTRERGLYKTVQSLANQVDHIFVYLNGYKDKPSWQGEFANLNFFVGGEDVGDTGKFYMADAVDG